MHDRALVLRAAVGDRELWIPAEDLQEVVPAEAIHPFPPATPGLAGVVALHGEPLPILSWRDFGVEGAPIALIAVLKRRLGIPLERVLEVRAVEGTTQVGLKRGDAWNVLLGHRRRLSGHSHGVLDVEKLLSLLHNQALRR